MSASIIAFCCAAILFVLALILFTVAVIKRKKRIFLYSGLAFLVFLIPSGFVGYKIVKALAPRTGMDTYLSYFGKPTADCVKVINFQDAEIPVMDFAVAFRFKTCPEELKRIISKKEYNEERISTKELTPPSTGVIGTDVWLNPQSLGDSVLYYRYSKENGVNGITIYSNTDMTEAFCIDVFN
jgi:hypothetical protein